MRFLPTTALGNGVRRVFDDKQFPTVLFQSSSHGLRRLLIPGQEGKRHGCQDAEKCRREIPTQTLAKIEQSEPGEHRERDDFLNDLQLFLGGASPRFAVLEAERPARTSLKIVSICSGWEARRNAINARSS
jgi:hypothetical protein